MKIEYLNYIVYLVIRTYRAKMLNIKDGENCFISYILYMVDCRTDPSKSLDIDPALRAFYITSTKSTLNALRALYRSNQHK